jgi:hypothetical protein
MDFTMRQVGKIGKLNQAANRKLKALFEEKEIYWCEIGLPGCTGIHGLSFAHRHKRIHYRSCPEKLHDWKQVVLSCIHCHNRIEQDAELTEEVFMRLRGKE